MLKGMENSFIKKVGYLFSGNMVVALLPAICSPILTRLYTPHQFGLLGIYSIAVLVLSTVATLSYENSIILPSEEKKALHLLFLSCSISLLTSGLIILLLWAFRRQVYDLLGFEPSNYIYIVPISVFATATNNSFAIWFIRLTKFKLLSLLKATQAIITIVLSIIVGKYFKGIEYGLIIGALSGTLLLFLLNLIIVQKAFLTSFSLDLKCLKNIAIRHIDFPKYTLPQTILDSLRNSGLILLVPSLYSTAILGQFSLSNRTFQAPISMLGGAFGQALFQEAATLHNSAKPIFPLLRKVVILLFTISIVPFICMLIWAPDIFKYVFGDEWKVAGEYSQILCPWMFLTLISSTISRIPLILNKQKQFLYFGILYTSVILTSFFIGGHILKQSFQTTLTMVSLSASIVLGPTIYWILRTSKKDHK
ncbi:lipopolysaccharide biosynthesis protein [Chitinophaga cymbidii]|uniref:lipopolysaccharide biosynthesis protein n=1 Tax=Chitinophaga cymbidii TaxID=1096750 RepID=UPI0011BF38DE|nr:oligosaccharide flippase family protein [Chitinophaga cymbidii]